jgi:hypothetical protein
LGVRRESQTSRQAVELAVLGRPFSAPGPSEHENCSMDGNASVKLLGLSSAGGFLIRSSPALAAAGSVVQHCSRHIMRTARQQLRQRAKSKVLIASTASWTGGMLPETILKGSCAPAHTRAVKNRLVILLCVPLRVSARSAVTVISPQRSRDTQRAAEKTFLTQRRKDAKENP